MSSVSLERKSEAGGVSPWERRHASDAFTTCNKPQLCSPFSSKPSLPSRYYQHPHVHRLSSSFSISPTHSIRHPLHLYPFSPFESLKPMSDQSASQASPPDHPAQVALDEAGGDRQDTTLAYTWNAIAFWGLGRSLHRDPALELLGSGTSIFRAGPRPDVGTQGNRLCSGGRCTLQGILGKNCGRKGLWMMRDAGGLWAWIESWR